MTKEAPANLTSWKREKWSKESGYPAAHPNARFTAPATQCPVIDPNWESPKGVPISGIIFGGRRSTTVPLVYEALNWNHGVFIGSSISSETTAAAVGDVGKLRHDPFAMLPFCGYHMGDYFKHWIEVGKNRSSSSLPRIFGVNWFRKSSDGSFLWPGYGQNIRVLKWCFERIENQADASETPIGFLPKKLDLTGLSISDESMENILNVDVGAYLEEINKLRNYYTQFGKKLPLEISKELDRIESQLNGQKRV